MKINEWRKTKMKMKKLLALLLSVLMLCSLLPVAALADGA